MLDTSGGAWISPALGTLSGEDVTRRCRHAVTSVGPFVFIYGGLKGSQLLDDLLLAGAGRCSPDGVDLVLVLLALATPMNLACCRALLYPTPPLTRPHCLATDDAGGAELTICDPRAPAWSQYLNSVHGSASAAQMLAEAAAAEAAAAAAVASRSNSTGGSADTSDAVTADRAMASPIRDESPTLTLNQAHRPGASPPTPDVRLYHRAVVAPMEPPLRCGVCQAYGARDAVPCVALPATGTCDGCAEGGAACTLGSWVLMATHPTPVHPTPPLRPSPPHPTPPTALCGPSPPLQGSGAAAVH